MAEEKPETKKAKCLKCGTTVTAEPRRIAGCNCDPDAPTWVYIENNMVKGFSQARWDVV
jgi:hypothetical protein